MAYSLSALVGNLDVIRRELQDAGEYAVSLGDGLALLPLSEHVQESLDPTEASDLAKELSRHTPIALLNADYFGGGFGNGGQTASVWEDGRQTYSESETELQLGDVSRPAPINAALRHLGVTRTTDADEFDTVNLGRCRNMQEWEQANCWPVLWSKGFGSSLLDHIQLVGASADIQPATIVARAYGYPTFQERKTISISLPASYVLEPLEGEYERLKASSQDDSFLLRKLQAAGFPSLHDLLSQSRTLFQLFLQHCDGFRHIEERLFTREIQDSDPIEGVISDWMGVDLIADSNERCLLLAELQIVNETSVPG